MSEDKSILKFPCRFPIKVMGDVDAALEELVRETLEQHLNDLETLEFKSKVSGAGNYISITATFTAENQEQLDRIYTILSQHERVK